MVSQNGVLESDIDIPLPCSTDEEVEVPSQSLEGYTYILRVPDLRERMKFEVQRGELIPRLNQSKALIHIMRQHEDELHQIVGQKELFGRLVEMVESGESPTYHEIEPLEEEHTRLSELLSGDIPDPDEETRLKVRQVEVEEAIEEAKRLNPIWDCRREYEKAIRGLDPRYTRIAQSQAEAGAEYQIALVEALMWGVEYQGNRHTGLSKAQVGRVVDKMSNSDIIEVFNQASDLINLRTIAKKNSDSAST